MMNALIPWIWAAGVIHLLIASVNFFLPRELRYAENLPRLPTLMRQIYVVHSVYIVLVLLGLAGVCLVFAADLAGASGLGRALSGFMTVFWGMRIGIQLLYYDAAAKREHPVLHAVFTTAFAFLASVFAAATWGGGR